jgi:hypothetical protein
MPAGHWTPIHWNVLRDLAEDPVSKEAGYSNSQML